MSVQISNKKQIIFSIILVVIVLLVIEGFLRVYDFYYGHCDVLKSGIYKNMDYFTQRQMCNDYRDLAYLAGIDIHYIPNQHSKTVNIDNYGLRGPDISKNKAPNTYRIFFIGGSTAFGWGSTTDSTTISGYLQKKFDNLGLPYNIEVINAAVQGEISTQETYRIKNELISFEPDMFIVYNGWNDANSQQSMVDPKLLDTTPQKYVLTLLQVILPWYKTPIIAPELLDSLIHANKNVPPAPLGIAMRDHISEVSSIWHNNVKEICDLGNRSGFNTVVLLQPILGTGNKTMTEFEYNYYQSEGGKKNEIAYNDFAKGLSGLEKYCTKTADLRNVFDENSEFIYYDRGHMQDRGNEILSERIFKIISPIVLEDITKQSLSNNTRIIH